MAGDLRVGIVGAGFIGSAHARAARSAGARLVAVAATTPDRAKEAAIRLGAEDAAVDADALVVDPGIDVVHLCVPNSLHAPLARAALAAGKHVVCEKPLTTTLGDADDLVARLGAAGTVGTVPFVYRFYPMARELQARVASGELGQPHLVHGTYLQDWLSDPADDDWRVDPAQVGPSRAFADIGSHWFDLAELVLGDRVARVSARTRAVHGRPTEDLAIVSFETERGVLGSVVVSQVSPGHKNGLTLELSGERATGRFEQERPDRLWIGARSETRVLRPDPAHLSAEAARHVVAPPGHPQGYLDAVDRFVVDTYAAIRGEVPPGLPTFLDGRRAVAITEAVLTSAAAGGDWSAIP